MPLIGQSVRSRLGPRLLVDELPAEVCLNSCCAAVQVQRQTLWTIWLARGLTAGDPHAGQNGPVAMTEERLLVGPTRRVEPGGKH
jgi:hypothetical protein